MCYKRGLPEAIVASLYLMFNKNTAETLSIFILFLEWSNLDNNIRISK